MSATITRKEVRITPDPHWHPPHPTVEEIVEGDWKAWFAVLGTATLSVLEWLIGNPFSPEGHLILLVIIFSVMDFVFGTVCAIAARTWKFIRLKQGIGKLLLWGAMLVVSRQLAQPIDVVGVNQLLKFISAYLLVYLILVDLISVLKHCVAFSFVIGVDVPFLNRLIVIIQRWHDALPVPEIKSAEADILISGGTPKAEPVPQRRKTDPGFALPAGMADVIVQAEPIEMSKPIPERGEPI